MAALEEVPVTSAVGEVYLARGVVEVVGDVGDAPALVGNQRVVPVEHVAGALSPSFCSLGIQTMSVIYINPTYHIIIYPDRV